MDNPGKLATLSAQDEENKNQNTTQSALDANMCKQTQITEARLEPSYKQLGVEMNRTSFLCVYQNGHHNTERRT